MSATGKRALVTGAGGGVGRGIARALAAEGWQVGVNDVHEAAGQAVVVEIEAAGARAWLLPADVGDGAQVQEMFRRFDELAGGIDLLVNNAGVQTWAPLLELHEADWSRTIRTNLTGTFLCTQQAARRMQGRGGSIVNIGSGANERPFPKLSDYCASKGAIEMLTRVAAVELGPLGIRVNCVAPGCIEVERTRQEDPDYARTWGTLTPLQRVGTADDVAAAVVFLAGPGASFVTGQTLYVDGGLWSQVPWPYAERGEP
jgi:NAD(P)-dependent dehydrogenase (short-subunit alcohol dehydrogenase family)